MKASPFANASRPAPTTTLPAASVLGTVQVAAQANLPTVRPSSPLVAASRTAPLYQQAAISDKDVEGLGADLSRGVSQTTDKVIQKMTVNRFGELGEILANVQLEVDRLKPNDNGGVIGWIQSKFTDLRKQLMLRFESAQKAFNELETKMSQQIAIHTEWIIDLDKLYAENFSHYTKIVETIHLAAAWEKSLSTVVQNWAPINPDDPDGPMKMQAKQDTEARLNRLRIKIDMFRRLKVITENNGPKIRSQQETSRTVIQTLNDTIVQAIPLIKMEFAMHLQSLDAMRSLGTVNQTRQLANTSLQKSAESAREAALTSAKTLNTSMVSNETLDLIRTRMLETVTGIKKIQLDAQNQRESDAIAMMQSQRQYLTTLQTEGAV